jgi:hypothetical protein
METAFESQPDAHREVPMSLLRRRFAGTLAIALAFSMALTSCTGGEEVDADLVKARKVVAAAIQTLDTGDYRLAKLDLEPIVSPTIGDPEGQRMATALKQDVQTLDKARFAYVLAATLTEVDDWIKLIGQVSSLLTGAGILAPADLAAMALDPQAGTGAIAPIVGNLFDSLQGFSERMHNVLELIKSNASFELRLRDFPVTLGDYTIFRAPGQYDLGEVYLIDSMFLLLLGAVQGLNAIDYTVSLTGKGGTGLSHIFALVGELQTSDIPQLVDDILNLIGVVLYTQPKLLAIGDATALRASGDNLRDALDSHIRSLEFMRAERDTQDDDVIGYVYEGNKEFVEIHLVPQPIPGLPVDNDKLVDLRLPVTEDLLTSLDRFRSSLAGEPVRVSWAKDIVPLASLGTVTLLQTGAFHGLIYSALDLASLDQATLDAIYNVLDGDLLSADLVTSLIVGFIPDVFEFDLGAFFRAAVPAGPRDILPFFTMPTTSPIYEDGATVPSSWEENLDSITLLLEYECKVGAVESRAVPGNFLCDDTAGTPTDLSHFIPEVGSPISDPTFVEYWGSSGRLANLQLLPEGGDFGLGMPADGIASPIFYTALQDPTVGGLLYINLTNVPGNLLYEPTVQTHYSSRGLGDVSAWVPADNFTLNALIAGVIGAIVEQLL